MAVFVLVYWYLWRHLHGKSGWISARIGLTQNIVPEFVVQSPSRLCGWLRQQLCQEKLKMIFEENAAVTQTVP